MTWQGVIQTFQGMRDSKFFDPGYQEAMIALCDRLSEHPTFEPLAVGISHYLLTLKTDYGARQQICAGWYAPDFFHVEYTLFVADTRLRSSLDLFFDYLMSASLLPVSRQPPDDFYGDEVGWDAVESYLRKRAADGKDELAPLIVNLMPALRLAYESRGVVPQMEHSHNSIGFGIKDNDRFITVAKWAGNEVSVSEVANPTSDEMLAVLETFARRFDHQADNNSNGHTR